MLTKTNQKELKNTYLTASEVADVLRIDGRVRELTVKRLTRKGLVARGVGRQWRCHKEALANFMLGKC